MLGSARGILIERCKDRVVLLETVWVDRDVVALRRFSNLDGVDTVEEIDGPPDRRPSNTRGVDEFRDRELRVVGVDEQAEDVVRGADAKDIGVRVGIRIDTDRYILFRHFRHYLILCNDL